MLSRRINYNSQAPEGRNQSPCDTKSCREKTVLILEAKNAEILQGETVISRTAKNDGYQAEIALKPQKILNVMGHNKRTDAKPQSHENRRNRLKLD